MFGNCKVCQEKANRIEDLKSQIADLRKLALTSQSSNTLPIINFEANKILNGDMEVTELTTDEIEEQDRLKVAQEADDLFNGTY